MAMRHQRLVAPFARGSLRYASTDTKRQPIWKKLMNRVLGKEDQEAAAANKERREVIAAEREPGQDRKPKRVLIEDVEYEIVQLPPRDVQHYVATESAFELQETVGTEKWLRKIRDEGQRYRGYGQEEQWELSSAQWADLIRHTLVETLVLAKNGRKPAEVCNARRGGFQTWSYTRAATVRANGNNIEMRFVQPDHESQILKDITARAYTGWTAIIRPVVEIAGENVGAGIGETSPKKSTGDAFSALKGHRAGVRSLLTSGNTRKGRETIGKPSEWLNLPIQDPAIKLAIVRRIAQLSARRVTGTISGRNETLAPLVKLLTKTAAPRKVHDTQQVKALPVMAPNITVYKKRRTMEEKEMDTGRWKLIEGELLHRGLPIRGHKWPSNAKLNVV